jgi:superfamily II DNA or RNA helicase
MAALCTHLFIDEAHHAEAPTWSAFKAGFRERRVLQFTATPFREDGRPLDGKIIFEYPLRKAQQEGYFRPIRFRRVVEFNQKRSDEAIAKTAIEQLREDFDKGHILMARAESVARAKEIFKIYERYPEFKPVELHTGMKSVRERETIRKQILAGESRIVVCVDMLGEGFDLPELKIAAFHDIRKTLAVTLQLAGRFTRSHPDSLYKLSEPTPGPNATYWRAGSGSHGTPSWVFSSSFSRLSCCTVSRRCSNWVCLVCIRARSPFISVVCAPRQLRTSCLLVSWRFSFSRWN